MLFSFAAFWQYRTDRSLSGIIIKIVFPLVYLRAKRRNFQIVRTFSFFPPFGFQSSHA